MKKRSIVFGFLVLVVLSAGILAYALNDTKEPIEQYNTIARLAKIHPDYHNSVIPPNIAPLNFSVQEKGSDYRVKIYSKQGKTIEVFSNSGKIIIPQTSWRELLNENKGQELYFDVFVKTDELWNRFSTITNKIANEQIDSHLVYRKIYPGHGGWSYMGIYQRNLQNYNESTILNNRFEKDICINCHTFCANNPDEMLIDVRSKKYGTSALLTRNGAIDKIGTKFGFVSWHPTGRMLICAVSKPRLILHFAENYIQDIIEVDSALTYYLVDTGTVKTSPLLSGKDRLETYPTWSPNGKYLYFCGAPILWPKDIGGIPDAYKQVQYDLFRVSYDIDKDQWGELQTVLSAKDTGLSILEPRISPDGRWLLFCMCDYGSWPVHHPSSDLYLVDLEAAQRTGRYEYRRLDEINSDQSESWHSWSTNSRWMAFSSKKDNYVFTRIYLSYVDSDGKVYKPLLMPQKDPAFYDSCLMTYTVPEFTVGPVQITTAKLDRALRSSQKISPDIPITTASPDTKTGADYERLWQERE